MNLLMCANSSTMTKKTEKFKQFVLVKCYVSHVTCKVLHVMCPVSPFTCHLSLTPTATATHPPAANSPIIHSTLAHSRLAPKTQKKLKTHKIIETEEEEKIVSLPTNISNTPFDQRSTRPPEVSVSRWHRQTDTYNHGHGDSMTNSAQWGRVGENCAFCSRDCCAVSE